MIIDSLLNFFLIVFSLCFACFRLQLYSCYFILDSQPTVISQLFEQHLLMGGGGVRPVLYNFRGV